MSELVLQATSNVTSKPHPEGIYPAVCVGVFNLGLVETEFQGQKKLQPKVRIGFATELKTEEGRSAVVFKTFTASLHPKSRLSEGIGKWRGRPVVPGETIDLNKLVGASCTLVISHQQNLVGRTYAAIDAISKPTKKVAIPADFDAEETRRRIAEWQAKDKGMAAPTAAPRPAAPQPAAPLSKSPAPAPAQSATEDNIPFDPEVGF